MTQPILYVAKRAATIAALAAAAFLGSTALAADLTMLCAGAMHTPMDELLAHRDPSLPHVTVTYATAGAIRERIAKGERYDLLVAPADVTFDLLKQNLIDVSTRRALGTTEIGVAVKAGAPIPDIRTPAALRATLLAARKVVIVDPTKGTSGRLLEAMFREMQIQDQMRDKLIKVDGGNVTEAVARGEADLGFQQVSEILPVAGVRMIGTLPGELKRPTRYDIAMMRETAHRDEVLALLRELDAPAAHAVIRKSGFDTGQ